MQAAAGPYFLTAAVAAWRALRPATGAGGREQGAGVKVLPLGVVYTSAWDERNPCGQGGSDAALDACASAMPSAVATTFWLSSWNKALAKKGLAARQSSHLGVHALTPPTSRNETLAKRGLAASQASGGLGGETAASETVGRETVRRESARGETARQADGRAAPPSAASADLTQALSASPRAGQPSAGAAAASAAVGSRGDGTAPARQCCGAAGVPPSWSALGGSWRAEDVTALTERARARLAAPFFLYDGAVPARGPDGGVVHFDVAAELAAVRGRVERTGREIA